jgi:hypothetical protein
MDGSTINATITFSLAVSNQTSGLAIDSDDALAAFKSINPVFPVQSPILQDLRYLSIIWGAG